MAQSAITVTPPNPTPPTNMQFLGTTPPTAPAQTVDDDGPVLTDVEFAPQSGSVDGANFPSAAPEGRGTEVVWTATSPNPSPAGQLRAFSCLGSYTNAPNRDHASSLSPATNPALASIAPTTTASGAGNQLLTATGTGFTKQSVIYVNGVAQNTTFVSATSLTANVAKKPAAGTWPVKVVTGGAVETAPQTWTFT